jgi:hypothetical protein
MSEEYGAFNAPAGGLFDNPQATKPAASLRESKAAKRDAYKRSRNTKGPAIKKVLAAIQAAGNRGVTRQEIADATGLKLQTVCGRVNDLLNQRNEAGERCPVVFIDGKRGGASVCFAKGYC